MNHSGADPVSACREGLWDPDVRQSWPFTGDLEALTVIRGIVLLIVVVAGVLPSVALGFGVTGGGGTQTQNPYGLWYAGKEACAQEGCHSAIAAKKTPHSEMVKDLKANPSELVPSADSGFGPTPARSAESRSDHETCTCSWVMARASSSTSAPRAVRSPPGGPRRRPAGLEPDVLPRGGEPLGSRRPASSPTACTRQRSSRTMSNPLAHRTRPTRSRTVQRRPHPLPPP